ncbi:protein kinase family protein [Tengunoibacter tsumagoiensis]|uniref:non-specific serine/threonine protein kinase n=1 Tax=Tengunoibacter tsumagoiensis TaxID=2014871 RepID=A0A402AAK8_9CHLR|nr:protein kinase family protein [Tengunoibacter tsumagoiensis]GCE16160.1 hypothetical protein KTT_60190 [Tengunoibacter tsumagoiensis]
MEDTHNRQSQEGAQAFCLGHPAHPLQAGELVCPICGTLAASATIGMYRIQRNLGTGRSGHAYLAIHQRSNQPAVIKLIAADNASVHLWDAARREVRVITTLRHRSILPVFSCSTWVPGENGSMQPTSEMNTFHSGRGTYLLTLCQYLPANISTFATYYQKKEVQQQLLSQGVSLSALLMHLVQQAGSALSAVHGRGLVHGALTPGNILLSQQHHLWLADFGLARLHPPTAPYLAPELYQANSMSIQANDMRIYWNAAKPSSDQYALAIICQQLFSQLLSATDYQYLLPVLQRAAQQRPEQRYPGVDLFVQDLMALISRSTTSSSQTQTRNEIRERSGGVQNPVTPPPPTAHTEQRSTTGTDRSSLSGIQATPIPHYLSDSQQMTPPLSLTPLTPLSNNTVEDWEKRGDKLFTTHDYDGALQAYHRALEIHGNKSSLWLALGDTYFALERYKEALMAYEQAMYLNPNDSQAWSNRGTVLDALGRRQEAMDCYERAEQLS